MRTNLRVSPFSPTSVWSPASKSCRSLSNAHWYITDNLSELLCLGDSMYWKGITSLVSNRIVRGAKDDIAANGIILNPSFLSGVSNTSVSWKTEPGISRGSNKVHFT